MLVRTLLAILIPLIAALIGIPQARAQGSTQDSKMMVLETTAQDGSQAQIGIIEKSHVSKSKLDEVLADIPADKDVILSTDSKEGAEKLLASMKKKTGSGLRWLIPLGPLKNMLAETWDAAKKDHFIGLTIVTYSTGVNSFVWLHATEHSPEVRAAQIIFSTLTAIALSIDRNAWARMSRKLNNKILNVFSAAGMKSVGENKIGKFASLYGANWLMSSGMYGTSFMILSYDHAINLNYLAAGLGAATAAAAVNTFSGMGWNELLIDVDQAKNPYAKFILSRIANIRSAITGHYAPNAHTLQPGMDGYLAWKVLLINGTVGYLALIASNKIVDGLEKGATWFRQLKGIDAVVKLTQEGISFLKSMRSESGGRSCRSIYAGAG